MLIIKTGTELNKKIASLKSEGQSIGFVPTMGALHDGHLSLIHKSKTETDITVCSIFVNPTQFNNPKDLLKYPNTLEHDLDLLKKMGCDLIYNPNPDDIYPEGLTTESIEFGSIANVMEGSMRPGHFDGVATVVSKLFEIVSPDYAYFGEKDYQQLAIIRKLVEIKKYPINIVGCPIIRENDGLAMSSRNTRLSTEQRKDAPLIYETIGNCKINKNISPDLFCENIKKRINKAVNLEVEYVNICLETDLSQIRSWPKNQPIRIFAAVFAGEIRLIDNAPLF